MLMWDSFNGDWIELDTLGVIYQYDKSILVQAVCHILETENEKGQVNHTN